MSIARETAQRALSACLLNQNRIFAAQSPDKMFTFNIFANHGHMV